VFSFANNNNNNNNNDNNNNNSDLTTIYQDNPGRPVPERQTILDFSEAEMTGWQWHLLDHMQVICTSLQTDNHTSTSALVFKGRMLFLPPNQQCQSTKGSEGKEIKVIAKTV